MFVSLGWRDGTLLVACLWVAVYLVKKKSPHIFKEDLRLNSDGYVEPLSTVVKPWVERVADARPYVAGLDAMFHLREESEVAVRKLVRLHQPEYVAS